MFSPGGGDPRTARSLGVAWMAVGLALTAAGWSTESGVWMWVLVLVGLIAVLWGRHRSTRC